MIKWSWRKSRRSTWLSQRYTMNQVSTLSSLAGLLFIAGIKNVKISRATLSFASHLFSLPLVKINVRHIKESMRRLLVRHLKPEIFWFTALVMQLGYALAPSPSANPLCWKLSSLARIFNEFGGWAPEVPLTSVELLKHHPNLLERTCDFIPWCPHDHIFTLILYCAHF